MSNPEKLTVIQTLPALDAGGVERGTLQVAAALVKYGHRSIVISAGGRLVEELQDIGSEHITLSIGKKSPRSLLHTPALRQILSKTRANILHARSRLPAWISYLAWNGMPVSTRPRFITSVHGHYSVNRYSKIMLAGERVIAISEYIREYITLNYPDIPQDKVLVIPRGVDSDEYPYKFHPNRQWLDCWQQQYPELVDKTIITLPGRITRRKGQVDFLRVLADLSKSHKNVHGLIVGAPDPGKETYYHELKNLSARLGLQNRVTFTDHRNDLREILSISSIVMSLSNAPEAFGRTVLESLCLGVPVIAYAHGGTVEILNALFPSGLIPANNIDAAITRANTFVDHAPSVPDNNPFTLQRMLDSTIALYESISSESVMTR
jgi:glycosyltransferase involved in cell wall biosynthesis